MRDRFATRGPANELASKLLPWISVALALALFRTHHALLLAVPMFAIAGALAVVQSLVSWTDVGPDGVYLRWLGWRWHVPSARITGVKRVKQNARGVLLHVERTDGPPVAVLFGRRPMLREGTPTADLEALATAFETRIAELLAARRGDDHDIFARLAEGRSVEGLRALASEAETFRSAGLDREHLVRIVEDASAPAPLRVRAAIAASGDPAIKKRIHAAASQSTLPELRVALAQVDDEGIGEAMHAVDKVSK